HPLLYGRVYKQETYRTDNYDQLLSRTKFTYDLRTGSEDTQGPQPKDGKHGSCSRYGIVDIDDFALVCLVGEATKHYEFGGAGIDPMVWVRTEDNRNHYCPAWQDFHEEDNQRQWGMLTRRD